MEPSQAVDEARFRTLFEETTAMAIQGYLPDGTVVYWNRASELLYGYSADEALGGNLIDLIIPEAMRQEVAAAVRSMFETGQAIPPGRLDLKHKSGRRVPVYSSHTIVDLPGQPPVMFCMDADMSALDLCESNIWAAKLEADRANLAKSKFLAAASHDLRQPVQTLLLLLASLHHQFDDRPKASKALEMMRVAVDGLNGLLTGILDISRLDAGVVTPTMDSIDLGILIGRLADEYAVAAADKGLRLRAMPRPLRARTDATLLERALRNLIENALRYTPAGGILIGLRRRGERVSIDVVDTGIGIPEDTQSEIFEEFYQVNNPGRDRGQGLGLGLAIVTRLVGLLGAEVRVTSRLDHGSRFSLLLPLDHSDHATQSAPTVADTGSGGRVLLIEDDTPLRDSIEILLDDWGYASLTAASGEEALDLATREGWRFDAVIADHRLGAGLTGTATATEIGRRAGRSFPTLILTGDTAKERIAEVHASGFVMLHKPVGAEDLRSRLAHLIRGTLGPA
jgi:PAS domain S-box-containing protein